MQLSENEKGVHEAHQMRICIWKGCLQKISIHTKAHTKNLLQYENEKGLHGPPRKRICIWKGCLKIFYVSLYYNSCELMNID